MCLLQALEEEEEKLRKRSRRRKSGRVKHEQVSNKVNTRKKHANINSHEVDSFPPNTYLPILNIYQ